jgi:hypothetical protein
VTLLTVGAVLVVLGIFNEFLKWDIFGPRIEALLRGVFVTCLSLAGFGVAITMVVGIRENVEAFRSFAMNRSGGEAGMVGEAPRRHYLYCMALVCAALALIVGACAAVNQRILVHRAGVFKHLAREQMGHFSPKLAALLAPLGAPPRDHVPPELHDLVRTLDGLSFIQTATVYLPDPIDRSAMWGYTAWRCVYMKEDGFARFFVAKDFEKAARRALDGDASPLDRINGRTEFIWYGVVKSAQEKPLAVLRLDGNDRESFRDYVLGD